MVRQPTAKRSLGWQIPENIFRCEGIQPTCPLKPDTTTSRSFPQTRNGEKTGLSAAGTGYRAILLHPSGFLGHWGHGCWGNHLLQASCNFVVTEMGNPIQQDALLVKVSPELLTHQISHPGSQRGKILPRACCKATTANRPCQQRGTDLTWISRTLSTLYPHSFLLFLYTHSYPLTSFLLFPFSPLCIHYLTSRDLSKIYTEHVLYMV